MARQRSISSIAFRTRSWCSTDPAFTTVELIKVSLSLFSSLYISFLHRTFASSRLNLVPSIFFPKDRGLFSCSKQNKAIELGTLCRNSIVKYLQAHQFLGRSLHQFLRSVIKGSKPFIVGAVGQNSSQNVSIFKLVRSYLTLFASRISEKTMVTPQNILMLWKGKLPLLAL